MSVSIDVNHPNEDLDERTLDVSLNQARPGVKTKPRGTLLPFALARF